jgi:hypothetical protein
MALAREDGPARVPIVTQFSDQCSFLWDKRRSLWIAAEDGPDGEQIEEADLDILLAQLPSDPECAG